MHLHRAVMIAIIATILLTQGGISSSHGVEGYSESGCTCHGETPGENAEVEILGIPEVYEQGQEYFLTIRLSGGPDAAENGHTGGFNLKASLGDLEPTDLSTYVTENNEITHDHGGANQREWIVKWIAPISDEAVNFTIAGNIVDGDHQPSDLDDWALNQYSSSADELTFSDKLQQLAAPLLVIALFATPFLMLWRREKKKNSK